MTQTSVLRWMVRGLALIALTATFFQSAGACAAPEPALEAGFRQMYNLDFTGAHHIFQAWQQTHPQDPLGFASDAAAYLFAEFDRLHVLETDLFINNQKFQSRQKLSPDPAVRAAFEASLSKTEQLASTATQSDRQRYTAIFSQVLASGLRGDYAAMVEKRNLTGLGYMKRARGFAEQLLVADPDCYDAYLAVGVENYLLGTSAAPLRWMLRLTGAQTNKEQGLADLRLTADKGHYLAPYARLLLAVAALRDNDLPNARSLLRGLANEFPKNQLYAKELSKIGK